MARSSKSSCSDDSLPDKQLTNSNKSIANVSPAAVVDTVSSTRSTCPITVIVQCAAIGSSALMSFLSNICAFKRKKYLIVNTKIVSCKNRVDNWTRYEIRSESILQWEIWQFLSHGNVDSSLLKPSTVSEIYVWIHLSTNCDHPRKLLKVNYRISLRVEWWEQCLDIHFQ